MNKKRLLKMADFVETIPRRQFNMGLFLNDCGTVGCALGWAAEKKLFRGLKVVREFGETFVSIGEYESLEAAEHIFDISYFAAHSLFLPHENHHTPKQVAANIRKFVKSDGALPC